MTTKTEADLVDKIYELQTQLKQIRALQPQPPTKWLYIDKITTGYRTRINRAGTCFIMLFDTLEAAVAWRNEALAEYSRTGFITYPKES